MLGNLFTGDLRASVLQEKNVATTSGTLRLRPRSEVNELLHRLKAPLIVIKPIVESQWAPELLAEVAESRVIWMYRGFRDVVQSNVKKFRSQIEGLRIAVEGEPSSWRNERLSLETQQLQKRMYHPGMSRENAAAVGWYARNSLFFQLGLHHRPDVHLVKYEELASQPQPIIAEVYSFLLLPPPGREIWREVDSSSIGRGTNVHIDPWLADNCEELQMRMDECFKRQQAEFSQAESPSFADRSA